MIKREICIWLIFWKEVIGWDMEFQKILLLQEKMLFSVQCLVFIKKSLIFE
jgi:hypothetical protein